MLLYFCVEAVNALCTFISEITNHDAIFFPRVIVCTFFLIFCSFIVVRSFGVLESWIRFFGLGIPVGWAYGLWCGAYLFEWG